MLKKGLGIALSAAFAISTAMAGSIVGSKHDIAANNPGITDDNNEICVYCHTPHGANTEFSAVPIWNKLTPNTDGYTMYGTTVAGNNPESAPRAPSLACLSCHDGVSAINTVVNAPGSGNYDPNNGITLGGSDILMPADSITNIGQDLSNDHPVSILYQEGAASLRPVTTTIAEVDPGGTWSGNPETIEDLLRDGYVECGSCHDPHNNDGKMFLRRTTLTDGENDISGNGGSKLCLTCHDK